MNRLSIIIPVYNGEKTIQRALDSLLKQSEQVDIIIVNDGSVDNTEKIIKEYKNSNIYYFYKENEGISEARNYGIRRVKTEFFGFLDSDDYVKEDMAFKMLNAIGDKDICMSNFTWVYDDGTRKKARDIGYQNKHEIIEKMYSTLWNKIYRTKWFLDTNLKFPKGLRYEDTSLLIRLAYYMDKVAYIDEAFVDYYQIKGSITHTYNININDMIEVFEGLKAFYIKKKAYEEYKPELEYLTIRFFLGSSYLRACRIPNKKVRKETLDKGWAYLTSTYPCFKKNIYLNNKGLKNIYFKMINKKSYYLNALIFNFLYKIGLKK